MKTTICAITLLAAAALPMLQAETAYTDPVMAQSKSLGPGYSVVSINALNPIEATGLIDALSIDSGDTVLEVSNIPENWSTNNFANPGGLAQFNFRNVPLYYVEITSGDKTGQILDVIATSDSDPATLTVGGDFSSLQPDLVGETFAIRKKRTIADVFGADNEVGLKGGLDTNTLDIIYNVFNSEFERIYYQEHANSLYNGWRIVGGSLTLDVGDLCIDPDFGLILFRRGTNDVELVTVGDVKLNTARTTIQPGYNALTLKFPVGYTLDSTGLSDVLDGGLNSNQLDQVYILSDGDFKRYYYQVYPADPIYEGWRQVGGSLTEDQGNIALEAGCMIIVFRRDATAVEWSLPQPFTLSN